MGLGERLIDFTSLILNIHPSKQAGGGYRQPPKATARMQAQPSTDTHARGMQLFQPGDLLLGGETGALVSTVSTQSAKRARVQRIRHTVLQPIN